MSSGWGPPIGCSYFRPEIPRHIRRLIWRGFERDAQPGPDRLLRCIREEVQLALGRLDQRYALGEPVIEKRDHRGVAGVLGDVAQETRCGQAVVETEQRAAVRPLEIEQAIEQEVAKRREQLADATTDHHARRLVARYQLVEARLHLGGVSAECT